MSEVVKDVKLMDIEANNMTFRCRAAGLSNKGEAIIFLHGFPETSILWTEVMTYFAGKGYRCLAPDQRGYSPKARPIGKKNYTHKHLAGDVVALADAAGFDKFHLVGHDWGAAAGWATIELFPDRVISWSALSVPHMAAFGWAKTYDPDQIKKSWYIDFFKKPLLPEFYLARKKFSKLHALWSMNSKKSIEDYMTVFGTMSGRTASINWYRANEFLPDDPKAPLTFHEVKVPTLLIWGRKDFAIGKASVEKAREFMKGEYKLLDLDAGHWLIQEKYDEVLRAIFDNISRHHPSKDTQKKAAPVEKTKKVAKKAVKKAATSKTAVKKVATKKAVAKKTVKKVVKKK